MTSVVVLTRDLQFWTEIDLRKFFLWYCKEKIEIIASDEHELVGSTTFKVNRPLVVRLLKFVGYKIKHEEVDYSKEAVFNRDKNICQYWHFDEAGRQFKYKCNSNEITLDHVMPKCQGGDKKSFLNSVTCCRWHNVVIKRGRSPEEAGLKLIAKPFIPKRNRGEFVTINFAYNPNKLSHRIYVEKILGGKVVE
jgi:hypothetical protein